MVAAVFGLDSRVVEAQRRRGRRYRAHGAIEEASAKAGSAWPFSAAFIFMTGEEERVPDLIQQQRSDAPRRGVRASAVLEELHVFDGLVDNFRRTRVSQ